MAGRSKTEYYAVLLRIIRSSYIVGKSCVLYAVTQCVLYATYCVIYAMTIMPVRDSLPAHRLTGLLERVHADLVGFGGELCSHVA